MIKQHHRHTHVGGRIGLRRLLHGLTTHAVLVETIDGQQRILGRYHNNAEAQIAAGALAQLVALRGGRMQILRARGVHPRHLRPLIGLGLLLLIGAPGCWPIVAPVTLALVLGMFGSDSRWR